MHFQHVTLDMKSLIHLNILLMVPVSWRLIVALMTYIKY